MRDMSGVKMADSRESRQKQSASDPESDPFSTMASALQDSWMVGIAAMRHILPPGTMTSADALPTAQEDIARQSQMALLVTQSYLAIATGSFRYFNGLTQTFAAHQHSIF